MKQIRQNNILIFEPHASGHHGPYLQWMATGLAERGFQITVVTLPESLVHPSVQAVKAASRSHGQLRLHVVAAESPGFSLANGRGAAGLAAREFNYWRLFRKWYRTYAENVRPDVVFLPYLDYCLHAISLLGSPFGKCPWVGLAMRPSFHYHSMGVKAPEPAFATLKKALFFRLIRDTNLRQLLTIDELIVEYLAKKEQALSKVTFFPEPVEFGDMPTRSEAKHQFGWEQSRKMILAYGAMSVRKGVVELLRALAAPGFPSGADVLLAGKVSDAVTQELLAEPWVRTLCDQGRLKLIDRFIETAEEASLFAAADIVWLGYRGHYNASGLLVQAANAGCPVVACEEGIIGWKTQFHELGRTVNPDNTEEVSEAFSSLLNGQPEDSDNATKELSGSWCPTSVSDAQDRLALALTHG